MLTMAFFLAIRGQLPTPRMIGAKTRQWLLIGSLGLTGNYCLYVIGLSYSSPAVAQTVMQIAPLLLLMFGTFVFHERFSRLQWFGFAALVFGLVVFFNRRLPELLHPKAGWSLGTLLIICSAVSWAVYGVSQKKLVDKLNFAQILFLVYAVATVILLPTARFSSLVRLHPAPLLALLFGVANTVVAYGAFGLALEVWEVSRVSSVVAAAPLFTLAGSALGARAALSWITPESLNMLSIAGALCVVAGSMVSALGSRPQLKRQDTEVHAAAD
jgi:drug/metabolite transporter (DMT)-like permease